MRSHQAELTGARVAARDAVTPDPVVAEAAPPSWERGRLRAATLAPVGTALPERVLASAAGRSARPGGARRAGRAIIPPVLLAVDVGNTQTHVGLFRDEELVEHWRFATVPEATADELATIMSGLLGLRDLGLRDVDGTMISAVVPRLGREYDQLVERYFHGKGALVGPWLKTGMPIRIDNPLELGADRLVNAVAAYDHVGGACIAVDFGTAINYDVVSTAGEYLGGVISPGIEISLEALAARAARLPRVDIEKPPPRDRQGHPGGDPVRRRLRLRRPGGRDRRPLARGAGRGGHGDRHRRLRQGDHPLLRAGRRGRRPAHAARPQAGLGAQPGMSSGATVSPCPR